MLKNGKYKNFDLCPVVCAAGDNYIICIPTPVPVLMRVLIGDKEYTNDFCGVKVSSCSVQKFIVPMHMLDEAMQYTVCYEIIYRQAYCSLKEKEVRKSFRYFPIQKTEDIHIYHLSDVHGRKAAAIKTGSYFSNALDLLILNGDISSSTQTVKESLLPLQIAYEITKGEKPCIITRGNHDLRGKYAERLGDFYPLNNGLFYYTVRLGPVWCLVMDCGEDKNDDHREYAGTIAFHKYRVKETDFLRSLVSAETPEYCSHDIRYRFVLSHIPFMHTDYNPMLKIHVFDIEQETYGEWVDLINTKIRPDFGLFGHVHKTGIIYGMQKYNDKGFLAPVVLGGRPDGAKVEGCGIVLKNTSAEILFNTGNTVNGKTERFQLTDENAWRE